MLTRLSTRLLRHAFVGAFSTLLASGSAAAQYSSITDLGDLGGGASVATSINARGEVAGVSLRNSSTQHGFIWRNGVMTDLGTLGGTQSVAYRINNRGQVVGGSNRTADASVGAFVWQDGVMTDLGGSNSFALGINESGHVVGIVYAADLLSSSAFVWHKGVMTRLPGLGGDHAAAAGINNRGQIVGQAQTVNGELHAAMWDHGAIMDLGTLGGPYGVAYTINAQGVACGYTNLVTGEFRATRWEDGAVVDMGTLGGSVSQCFLGAGNHGEFVGTSKIAGDSDVHAFVTIGGVMTDLNPQIPANSGWLLEQAYGINERGQIVGGGHRDGMAPLRAYLLSR